MGGLFTGRGSCRGRNVLSISTAGCNLREHLRLLKNSFRHQWVLVWRSLNYRGWADRKDSIFENRRYEDYEELGRHILEALEALRPLAAPDLRVAGDALKEVVDKAFVMWGDVPTMQTTLTNLRSLHAIELQPRVEQAESEAPTRESSPSDTAYLVNEQLSNMRGCFQEAFERDASAHEAFASRLTRKPVGGGFYSPLYSKEENEGF
jgi:hypothetical protein